MTDMWMAFGSIEDQILYGAREKEEMLKAQKFISEEHPDMPIEERQKTLSRIGDLLRLQLDRRGLTRNRMCFPFVAPIPQDDDIKTYVKLDTGSHPKWIHSAMLKKPACRMNKRMTWTSS